MLLLWLLWLVPVALGQEVETDSDFIDPVETAFNVEYYDKDGVRYGIFLEKVSWTEARMLCPSRQGLLVEFKDPGVAEFIARALAESAVGYSALWIGGEYESATDSRKGAYWWVDGNGVQIPAEELPPNTKYPMEIPPYWVDKPNIDSKQPACLAVDRRMHHLPLITSLPCDTKRPFICALPALNASVKPTEVQPLVKSERKTFHLYQAQYTWAQALSFCRSLNYKLAVLETKEEFQLVGHRMLRSRPVIENAWTSGIYQGNHWQWVSTNQAIETDLSRKSKYNESVPFPPWYREHNIIKDGCLLADRHLCDVLVYVEARCDRKRSFICEEECNVTEPMLVQVEDSSTWVSTIQLPWAAAQNKCTECLGGKLLEISDVTEPHMEQVLKELYKAMTVTTAREIRHAWIGGYLINEDFVWAHAPNSASNPRTSVDQERFKAQSSQNKLGLYGLLVYCFIYKQDLRDKGFLSKYKCLNLDRENQKNFFMYGLQCSYKQYFICQAPPGRKLAPTCEHKDAGGRVTPGRIATGPGGHAPPEQETSGGQVPPDQGTSGGYTPPGQETPGVHAPPGQGTSGGQVPPEQGTSGGYSPPGQETPGGYGPPGQETPVAQGYEGGGVSGPTSEHPVGGDNPAGSEYPPGEHPAGGEPSPGEPPAGDNPAGGEYPPGEPPAGGDQPAGEPPA